MPTTTAPHEAPPEPPLAPPHHARLRAWALGALAVAGPPILLAVYWRAMYAGLTSVDALDFAQLGRSLAAGRGFSTSLLLPFSLSHGAEAFHHPDMLRGPLFPLILAAAFRLFGTTDAVAAGVSSFFYLLALPLAYLLGRRAFSHGVGAVTAVIVATNALMLDYAVAGAHLTLCICLMTALLLALYRVAEAGGDTPDRVPCGTMALAGALAALLYLADPVFLWVIPVVVGAGTWMVPGRPRRAALCLLLPLIAVAGPWMLRNARLGGDPAFGLASSALWAGTRSYPGMALYRTLPGEVMASPALLLEVGRKAFLGLGVLLAGWPEIAANWVLAFFLPSLLFRFSNRAAGQLRRVVIWAFLALSLSMVFTQMRLPLLVSLVPAVLAFAVAYLRFLAHQARLPRRTSATLTALLSAALLYPVAAALTVAERPQAARGAASAVALGRAAAPGDVVLTDQPWTVAWYADRPAVLLPMDAAGVRYVRQRIPSTRWLLLTAGARSAGEDWAEVYGVMQRWSVAAAAAQSEGGKPLRPLSFGVGPPLVQALEGFQGMQPLEPLAPGRTITVVAAAPRSSQPPTPR